MIPPLPLAAQTVNDVAQQCVDTETFPLWLRVTRERIWGKGTDQPLYRRGSPGLFPHDALWGLYGGCDDAEDVRRLDIQRVERHGSQDVTYFSHYCVSYL